VNAYSFVNTGALDPKDGDWRRYVLLDCWRDGAEPEFRRVEYDVERTAEAIWRARCRRIRVLNRRSGGDFPSLPSERRA
jgi:hypothetical protein